MPRLREEECKTRACIRKGKGKGKLGQEAKVVCREGEMSSAGGSTHTKEGRVRHGCAIEMVGLTPGFILRKIYNCTNSDARPERSKPVVPNLGGCKMDIGGHDLSNMYDCIIL